ncbi:hypothetical protein BDV12DRAFT_180004 [Aspergillus spectabilis]
MDQETHIIDPDGEVIIVLRNADTPITEATKADTNPPPDPLEDAAPRNSVSPVRAADWVPLYSKKGKKKKKNKKEHASSRAFGALREPAPELIREPVTESIDEPEQTAEPAPEATEDYWPMHEPTEYPIPEPSDDHVPEFVEAAVPEPIEEPTEEASGRTFRIQVSAKHLTLASPVFKQILTGGWKESATLLQKGSVEISAKGWDIDAFLVLLRVLHCQNSQLPQMLSLEMLANVAIIADYYKCKDAIGILKDIWIKALPEPDTTTLSRDLMLWLWVSFFFELPVLFKQATSIAMSTSDGQIDSLGLPIPGQLIENMNFHRQQAIEKLFLLLQETQDAFLNTDCRCGFECSSIMYGALIKELHRVDLLSPRPEAPFSELAYDQLMHKVSSIRSPIWFTKAHQHWGSSFQFEQHNCDSSSFAQLFGHLNDTVAGLDLQVCCLEY